MLGMTPVWSCGKRMPSPATMWRMGSCVTAGAWAGAGRLGFGFLFFGTARGGEQAGGQGGKQPFILHRLKGPRQCLKVGDGDAQADEPRSEERRVGKEC